MDARSDTAGNDWTTGSKATADQGADPARGPERAGKDGRRGAAGARDDHRVPRTGDDAGYPPEMPPTGHAQTRATREDMLGCTRSSGLPASPSRSCSRRCSSSARSSSVIGWARRDGVRETHEQPAGAPSGDRDVVGDGRVAGQLRFGVAAAPLAGAVADHGRATGVAAIDRVWGPRARVSPGRAGAGQGRGASPRPRRTAQPLYRLSEGRHTTSSTPTRRPPLHPTAHRR